MKQIFIFLSVCSAFWTVKAKKCERIREPMCKGIRYNFTTLPNGLGHPTQERARLEFHKFYPLLNRKCSKYLKEFMCAVYFPECRKNGKGPLVMPSREQCQESYKGCAHVMEKYGFEWPRNLNCYNFPGRHGNKKTVYPSVRKPLNIPSTFDLPHPNHKINILFSPRSITFPSCCGVYYYTNKVINVSPDAELFVKTADVRTTSSPEVTIEKVIDGVDYIDGKYTSLLMVNHYMETLSDKQLYVNWMVLNIVNEDVASGITIKEYEGPRPSIATSDTYHFLLYEHVKPVDIFTSGKSTNPPNSRYRLDLGELFRNNEVLLTATTKMKVDIDEYVRFQDVNEFSGSEQEVCSSVGDFPDHCDGTMATYSVNR